LTVLAWIGVGLLVLAVVLLAIAALALLPAGLRARRAAAETRELVLAYRLLSGISAMELQLAALERHELLRPWRRARRWLLHPLTIAVVESWARRRKRAQQARLEAVGLR
jgi:hypothetical protein